MPSLMPGFAATDGLAVLWGSKGGRLPLEYRRLWEEGMLLDLLHRENSSVLSQDKATRDGSSY